MFDEFYEKEKEKFNELLKKLNWTEESLMNEVCLNEDLKGKIRRFLERIINSMSN
jgi:hypothetical protein